MRESPEKAKVEREYHRKIRLDALKEALYEEHCGYYCDNACDIMKAYELGLYVWAAHVLMGATDETPLTAKAYTRLRPGKRWLQAEADELMKAPHVRCRECNAVVYTDEEHDRCGSCGKTLEPPDGVDSHGRCLGKCSECDSHLLATGRYTTYCPDCSACPSCGEIMVDDQYGHDVAACQIEVSP